MSKHITTFNEHFMALKKQLIIALVTIFTLFVLFVCFAQELYHQLALPLLENLPHNGQMIGRNVP